jgi:hypothetical protein
MHMKNSTRAWLCAVFLLAGCAKAPGEATPAQASTASASPPAVVEAPAGPAQAAPSADPTMMPVAAIDPSLPKVIMHRDPSCGCCEQWAAHMRGAGFEVEIRDEPQLDDIKRELGIPDGKYACHTAEVGDYVVEGHVPAEDVKRFLAAKPKAKGLVLPGMPLGSPGMGAPGAPAKPYTVERLEADGSTTPYAHHDG